MRLAAVEAQDPDLRRLRLAVFVDRAREREQLAVARPARRRVARSVRDPARLRAGARCHRPDGGVVRVLLFVDCDADERDLRAVRRELRITDPVELEQILLGDVARRGGCGDEQKEREEAFHGAIVSSRAEWFFICVYLRNLRMKLYPQITQMYADERRLWLTRSASEA